MRTRNAFLAMILVTLATFGGYWVGQASMDTKSAQKTAYEAGFDSGTCHPLVYEDGSYVLEDGKGNLCVKP